MRQATTAVVAETLTKLAFTLTVSKRRSFTRTGYPRFVLGGVLGCHEGARRHLKLGSGRVLAIRTVV